MLEDFQAESSNCTHWDEAFCLYANAISAEDDDRIKIQATMKLARMSKYAPPNILARTVPTLLDLLQTPQTQLCMEASAYCLKCIASRGKGRLAELIVQSGAIPIFLRLLPHSEEHLRTGLLKCLRNLVTFWEPNRAILDTNHGLDIILTMLHSCSYNSKLILLEILTALALVREVRKSLYYTRRVHYLIEAGWHGRLESRTRAAQAIGLLGSVKSAQQLLLSAGALPMLMDLLKVEDVQTKLVAGNALGVIGSNIDCIDPIAEAGAIPLYADLLRSPDPIGKEIAEDVLCIMAASEENTITVIQHLVAILGEDDPGAKAPAADVIWDLSCYNNAVSILHDSGAISILVELLKDESTEVKEKVAGAVAPLSEDEEGRTALANCGAISILVSMLDDEEREEVRENAAEALVNFWMDPSFAASISSSGAIENRMFQNMCDRMTRVNAAMDRADASPMRQVSRDQLTWHSGLD